MTIIIHLKTFFVNDFVSYQSKIDYIFSKIYQKCYNSIIKWDIFYRFFQKVTKITFIFRFFFDIMI